MTVLRVTELVAAEPRTVLAALTERAVLTAALNRLGIEITVLPGGAPAKPDRAEPVVDRADSAARCGEPAAGLGDAAVGSTEPVVGRAGVTDHGDAGHGDATDGDATDDDAGHGDATHDDAGHGDVVRRGDVVSGDVVSGGDVVRRGDVGRRSDGAATGELAGAGEAGRLGENCARMGAAGLEVVRRLLGVLGGGAVRRGSGVAGLSVGRREGEPRLGVGRRGTARWGVVRRVSGVDRRRGCGVVGQVGVGDEVVVRWAPVRWVLVPGVMRWRIVRVDATGLVANAVGGWFPEVSWSVALAATGAGTLLTSGLRWTSPGGVIGRAMDVIVGRRIVLRVLGVLAEEAGRRARRLAAARVVVGAVLVREQADEPVVLAAQRSYPAEAAGRWEFPGGKVGTDESEVTALERECREELGIAVTVAERIGPDVVLADDLVLRLYVARTGEDPNGFEHRALRWVGADELADLDWLDADRVVLAQVRDLLRSCGGRISGG